MTDNSHFESPESDVLGSEEIGCDNTILLSTGQRIGRLRWIAYNALANVLLFVVVGIGAAVIIPLMSSTSGDSSVMMIVVGILAIAFYVAFFAVSIICMRRRLHDLDKSGWMSLLIFVPLINLFFFLYLLFAPGDKTENRFGKKPQPNTVLLWIVGLLFPFFFIGMLASIALPAYQDYVDRAKAGQVSLESD